LAKELMVPAAAVPNLHQVLTFEMDRHTPFSANEVYFGWRILEQRSDEQVRVMLYAVPRPVVDRAREVLDKVQLSPSSVDVLAHGRSVGLNLLPLDRRARIVNRKTRLNQSLAAAAALLLAVVMWSSLALREHQIEELEAAIANVRDDALAVQRIRDQIVDTSKAAGFLSVRRNQSPPAVELLAEITRQLPDDTFLDRLVIGMTTIQMQGKSGNAQQLIEVVNDSPMLSSAAFRGSTRLDPRSGLEIFEINADITGAVESAEAEG
jgi:general secretion pathway protein L